ncbi:Fe-S protein assembly co-chaperone HscB [Methylophilaceae bacterium]|nr:Fe-S protein assembly co-chaperone HscB [Nitrosomonadales bacterium]MDC0115779.1 Fe-S protein assembly co-chaperone HscB [Methylophilaceae bacterium]
MTQNYFEIFGLPMAYLIDSDSLNKNYRLIQKSVHPDRFISATEVEKQQSLIKSTQVNDAYQTLKDPVKRAAYLIGLHYDQDETSLPPEFLMQQMEWEEELEECSDEPKMQSLFNRIDEEKKTIEDCLQTALNKKDWGLSLGMLGKLKFLTSLSIKIQQKIFLMDNS